MKKVKVGILMCFALIGLFATFCIAGGSAKIQCEILDEEVVDIPIKTEITLKVLMSGGFTEEGIKEALNDLYVSALTKKRYEYHKYPTSVYIFAFTSEKAAMERGWAWLARLSKRNTDAKPSIDINQDALTDLHSGDDMQFGLSKEKRKEIYKKLAANEAKVSALVREKYPPLDPLSPGYSREADLAQVAFEDELNAQNDEKIKREYGITRDQIYYIFAEGTMKNW